MTGIVVLGTDTDVGKTGFCLQWMSLFSEQFAYWKPVETGESDSEKLSRLVPDAKVFPPLARFREPVAPCLAALHEGAAMPGVDEIISAIPTSSLPLLIETFGSPFSPLTDDVLQIDLLKALGSRPTAQPGRLCYVLVSSSALGAVGRTLASLNALHGEVIRPCAVVLLGVEDAFAEAQIAKHSDLPVFGVRTCEGEWTAETIRTTAEAQRTKFESISAFLPSPPKRGRGEEDTVSLLARDRQAVWHPYTSLGDTTDPLVVVSAEAEFLHLADGRCLIDGISSWWTIQHGHRHPPLMAALKDASEKLDHVIFGGATHEPAIELAELMLATMPWQGGRAFYSDNGSTAVEVALKLAYQTWCHRGQPQRTLFVGFENGYHGDTFGAMAAGRDPLFFGTFEPLLFRTLQVPVSAEKLDAVLEQERGKVAAIIIEPLVQGAGGMAMHSPEELRAIYEVARKHGVFFIADEVMTGGGRTGTLWAFEQAGIAPDLICAAKTLAGGIMPLAATLVSPEIVEAFQTTDRSKTFFHGHSFTAHPLACAVAVANWRAMKTGAWRVEVRRIEAFLKRSLEPLRTHPRVKEIRIRGIIAAMELDFPGGYLADVGKLLRQTAIENGVLLRPLGNVLYAMPPYCTGEGSLTKVAEAFSKCLQLVR